MVAVTLGSTQTNSHKHCVGIRGHKAIDTSAKGAINFER